MARDFDLNHGTTFTQPITGTVIPPDAYGLLSPLIHKMADAILHLRKARAQKRVSAQLKADIRHMKRAAPHLLAEMQRKG